MKKFYYYAELNDNNVCVRIVSDTIKKVGSTKHIEIPEYNETYRYRKYDPVTEWSGETYEPSVDTMLQDKVDAFEVIVDVMKVERAELSGQITQLQGTIIELTTMIALLQGGK